MKGYRDQRSNQAHLELQSYATQTELFRHKIHNQQSKNRSNALPTELFRHRKTNKPHSKEYPKKWGVKLKFAFNTRIKISKHWINAE